jgi:hypothetical protein
MKTYYRVQFKHNPQSRASVGLSADTPEQALYEAAKMLGMDTDPETQTYTLALEAIEKKSALNKWQRREIETMQKMQHFGPNYIARGLSMLHRSAPKKSQQAEILALAIRLGVNTNPEFIISDTFATI